jgi:hypothetical protein
MRRCINLWFLIRVSWHYVDSWLLSSRKKSTNNRSCFSLHLRSCVKQWRLALFWTSKNSWMMREHYLQLLSNA